MQPSNPRPWTAQAHLASPPATPKTRQSLIFAICPTMEPTAPGAAATTTLYRGFGLAISSSPTKAVTAGMPRTPNAYDGEPICGGSLTIPTPLEIAYSCQPLGANTQSPSRKLGWRDRSTRATVSAIITCPTATGGA